jgi:hypothetical protein
MNWTIEKVIRIGEAPIFYLVYRTDAGSWYVGFAYSLEEALAMARKNQEKDHD